ncbi:DUF1419 domain-containing protein [Salmonella enterica subsp. enterica]|nr:DUF1419 domain-containing protein [Salmonella enterica subsp. enterica]MIF52511.1 DUF1419 domain-containing protein [Salmonella enterica subsp. enterica]
MSNNNMVFWKKNSQHSDWFPAYLVDGVYRTIPGVDGWSLNELNAHGDYYELISENEAYLRYSNSFILPVTEISSERFDYMLEVLPPLDWHFNESGGAQSFKLAEMYADNVTNIFAKYGDRFFELRDHVTLTHSEIIERVKVYVDAAQTTA